VQLSTAPIRAIPTRAAVTVVALATAASVLAGCSDSSTDAPVTRAAPITSTTQIATAGVLGNGRRPDESCAPEPAALDEGPATREVRHAAGVSAVPADPQRIVALSDEALDTLCALGLQSRIVGAAISDGTAGQPSYLGTVIRNVPAVGAQAKPDLAAIKAATPDLILGSQAVTGEGYGALSAIAPTVFTGAPGAAWRDNLHLVGTAVGRGQAAGGLVDGFADAATKVGAQTDAAHFQVSVVQLTETTMRIWGTADFPGSVLAAIGADRPGPQRFSDKPYHEIDISQLTPSTDFSTADGDIVYVSFDSAAAKSRAATLLDGPQWKKLSATRDHRVFVVNNEVWHTGGGIVAARGMLDDLHWLNAPIN